MTLNRWQLKGWKTEGWSIYAIVLFSFIAGSLMTARWVHVTQVRADSSRVFEMHIYHTVLFPVGMSHDENERVVPRGRLLGYPVTHNIQTMFGE